MRTHNQKTGNKNKTIGKLIAGVLTIVLTFALVVIARNQLNHNKHIRYTDEQIKAAQLVQQAWDLLNASDESSRFIQHLTRSNSDKELAHRMLEEANLLDPKNARLYVAWAMYYHAINKPSLAREEIDHAVRLDPNLAAAWVTSVQIAVDAEEFQYAVRLSNRGMNYTNAPALMVSRAVALFELGEKQTAIDSLLRESELEPNNTQLLSQLAVFYNKTSQLDLALTMYKRVLVLDPLDPITNHNIAILYRDANQLDSALKHIKSALSKEPENLDSLLVAAKIYELKEDFVNQIMIYKRALEIDPLFQDAVTSLANVYAEELRFDEARELLDHFELFYRDRDGIIQARAYVEFKADNIAESLKLLDRAIQLGGPTPLRVRFREHLVQLLS